MLPGVTLKTGVSAGDHTTFRKPMRLSSSSSSLAEMGTLFGIYISVWDFCLTIDRAVVKHAGLPIDRDSIRHIVGTADC